MSTLLSDLEFLKNHWQTVTVLLAGCVSFTSTLITAATPYPKIETWLHFIQGLFSWAQHLDVGGMSMVGVPLRKPAHHSGPSVAMSGAIKAIVIGSLLAAAPARAQVLSTGASLPMIEVQADKLHPVTFAPGLGVEGSLGFFQFGFLGKQWDALNLSVQLFGNAPGALQVAGLVGTVNNIIAVGVAVPLFALDGSGAFQGQGHAYPVLSLSIPIGLGPYQPPVGTTAGPKGLPRGGTVYFP